MNGNYCPESKRRSNWIKYKKMIMNYMIITNTINLEEQ